MFCPNCGTKIGNVNFCPECGTYVAQFAQWQANSPATTQSAVQSSTPPVELPAALQYPSQTIPTASTSYTPQAAPPTAPQHTSQSILSAAPQYEKTPIAVRSPSHYQKSVRQSHGGNHHLKIALIVGGAVFIILAGVVATLFLFGSKKEIPASTPVSEPTYSTPSVLNSEETKPSDIIPAEKGQTGTSSALEISYRDLYQKKESYAGAFVRIAGKVSSNGQNIMGVNYITIRDGLGDGLTDELYLNLKDISSLSYSKGDYVVVTGTVGSSLAGTLDLDDCMVEAVGEEAKKKALELNKTTSDISITSTDLLKAYEKNGLDADNQYKDKVLAVTGIVGTVGKDILDQPYITLKSDDSYNLTSIQCYLNEIGIDQAVSISKGDTVTVIGICNGENMNVTLKDCAIQ